MILLHWQIFIDSHISILHHANPLKILRTCYLLQVAFTILNMYTSQMTFQLVLSYEETKILLHCTFHWIHIQISFPIVSLHLRCVSYMNVILRVLTLWSSECLENILSFLFHIFLLNADHQIYFFLILSMLHSSTFWFKTQLLQF